jgi:NAD(P)-dependent dehydrogenase (short-subunit alcohol dehydrogenase family)
MSKNLSDLTGKLALISGASRGIGEEIAKTLADNGARVIVSSRKIEDCQVVADGIIAAGGKADAFAKECAPLGIRCNALLPGLTKTKFFGALFAHDEYYKQVVETIPMGRHAEPQEMAGTVPCLVSDASSYTTDETIVVDGGGAL